MKREVGAGGVHAEHHAQPVGLLENGQEARVAEQMTAVGRQHGPHVPQLAHGPTQLGRRGIGVLHGQQSYGLQPRTHLDELLVHEGVVGPAQGHGPLPVAQEAHEQPERRIEHSDLHPAFVHGAQPRGRVSGDLAERAQEPPVPAVLGKPGEAERAAAIRLVEVPAELLLALGDVTVGVYDVHSSHSCRFTASCR
jgi:hypothetical protein